MGDDAFSALLAVVDPNAAPSPAELAERLQRPDGFCGWPVVVEYAERHRIMPLLANRLSMLGWMDGTAMPVGPDLRVRLEKLLRNATFAELASLAELKRITDRFGEHGIAPILLKGLALSSLCFGKIGWRTNHDIDLLIDPSDLATCDRILAEMDYMRVEPSLTFDAEQVERWRRRHKDWVYVHRTRRTIVEVHYRLFDNERLCRAVKRDEVEPIDLFGQLTILSLKGEALRTYLALHGLLHSWSRVKWLIDYHLIRPVPGRPDTASIATRVADRLCARLFPSSPRAPAAVLRYGRTALLVHSSLNAMAGGGARELEQTRFGTTVKNLSHYLISLHPAYWFAEIGYDLADMSRDAADERSPSGFLWRVAGWFSRKFSLGLNRST